jgi:hypothetical protein
MVMSITAKDAAIVRLYGHATATAMEDSELTDELLETPPAHLTRLRQVITIDVESTQTSCGYSVPIFEYVGERQKNGRGRKYKESTRKKKEAIAE